MYVSTTTGSVTRHTDDGRQFEANLFTNFHKFGFIPNKNLRDLVLTTLTFGIFLASVLGIILFSSHAGRGMDGRNVTNGRTRSSAIPIILLHLNAEIGERAGALRGLSHEMPPTLNTLRCRISRTAFRTPISP